MTLEEKKIEATAKQLARFSPLQEVNEEERYYQSHKCTTYDACLKMAKSDSVKEYWQKGVYSEEKVRELFKEFRRNFQLYRCIQILDSDFEKWLEQNKEK